MKRILVVEDELDMRIFVSTIFETNGFEVVTARDGKLGFDVAKEKSPDLIILDLMMPGQGGVNMYQNLKKDDSLRNIPVVMLSGVDKKTFYHYLTMMNINPAEAIPEPNAYIEKPPNPDEILETVRKILDAWRTDFAHRAPSK